MFGYSYSPTAPAGLIFGINNIGASPLGIYGRYGMDNLVIGVTCSMSDFVYLTCGPDFYNYGDSSDIAIDAGIIIKPVSRIGISEFQHRFDNLILSKGPPDP